MKKLSRRHFLQNTGITLGGSVMAATLPSFTTIGKNKYNGKKLNIALVGLGRYAGYLAEGLQQAQYCRLAGIVTGTPSKAVDWKSVTTFPMPTYTITKTSIALKTIRTLTWSTLSCPIPCIKNMHCVLLQQASTLL